MDRAIEKKVWTTGRILTLAGALGLVTVMIWALFIRDNRSKLYVQKAQLTIAEVVEDKFQEFIPVDGILLPRNTVYIDAVQGGVVEEVYVEDGAMLKKGDPILKVNNANMELSYMDQETRMYDAINNLANTLINIEQLKYTRQKEISQLHYQIDKLKADFKRKQGFFSENLISKVEFEDAQRDYNQAMNQLELSLKLKRLDSISGVSQSQQISSSMGRMKNNLSLLQRNMDNMTIKSPGEGKLSSFNVEIGETKTAGEHLGQIDIQGGFKVRANVDERYISRIFQGQEAEFDMGGKVYQLSIHKIYTNVTNGSFQVDLVFASEEPASIKRGQTLQLRIKFSGETNALTIKRGGFFQETGGNWIYVVDADGKSAQKRNIKIGRQNIYSYEVLEGLNAGEKVIVSSYEPFGNKEILIFR
jgi:HlyD family secretion protein